jgi:hypothetical protein
MALVLADRVRDTTATTGTGTVTLSGTAPTGYQNFSVIGNGNTTYYTINGDSQWEVGIGTYTSSGTTLSRNTVLASSSGGSLVDFAAGTKDVFVTYPSEKAVTEDYGNALAATTAANLAGGAAGSIPYQTAANTTAMLATGTGVLIGGTTPSYTASPSLTQVTVAGDPSTALQVATKQYVDGLVASGITYHEPVKYEVPNSTGNLNATYNQPGGAGNGVGATLTNAGTKAAFAPDGPTASVGDRILVYNQTSAFQNGIYTVTTVGTPDPGGTNWVLTRATDADTYGIKDTEALGNGDSFFVSSGDTGAGETYVCNTAGTIVFGSTAITFVQVSDATLYTAGNGLQLTSGTVFSLIAPVTTVNGGTGLTSFTSGGAVYATSSSALTTGTLPATAGGTGNSSFVAGDLLYATSSTAIGRLADVATGNALISGGVGADPSWGKIGLTTHVSGTLPVGNGGTGATSLTGYLVGNGTSAFTATATIPTSALSGTISLTTQVSGTLGAGNGGTGISSYTVGDILYASGTTTLSSLADVATGNALISGGVSNPPSWGKIGLTTHVSGTLPVSNGGSGATTLTGYLKGNGTSAFTASATIPSGDITGAALTEIDDTNVTLTLGGSPTTALLAATSITAGWSGQLAVSRGGTGNSTLASGYLLKGNGVSPTSASVIYDDGTNAGVGTTSLGAKWDVKSQINVTSPSNISMNAVRASNFGYSTGYSALILGSTSGNNTPCINVDPIANPSGSFSGLGDEVMFRNGVYFISPNSANTAYNQYLRLIDGYVQFTNSARAPIFYDSSNTAYYVDPVSGSNLGGGVAFSGGTQVASNGDVYARRDNGTTGVYYFVDGGTKYLYWDGGQYFFGGAGVVTSPTSFRAPLFYDSDNTAYYIDGAGTSNIVGLQINGTLNVLNSNAQFWGSTNGAYQRVDTRTEDTSLSRAHWYGVSNVGGTSNFRHAWYDGAAYFNVTASSSQISFERTAGNTAVYSSGDFRAPIFYDSNNTAFYIDAASTSVINGLNAGIITAQSSNDIQLYLNGNGTSWAGISWADATATDYIWYNGSTSTFAIGGGGSAVANKKLHINGGTTIGSGIAASASGTNSLLVEASITANQMYSQIFYDSQNGAYYVDPASTSRLNNLSLDTIAITSGITGLTSAPITTQYYNIGTTPTWMPMTYQRAVYNSGYVTHLNTGLYKNANAWGSAATGWYAAIGGNDSYPTQAWYLTYDGYIQNSLGYVSTSGSFRAPIFYDENNTGYYVDPASGTVLGGTVSILGGRNITLSTSGGNVQIKGDAGGWSNGLLFYGSSNTFRGGFGALGSGDGLSYLWAGNDYNNAALYLYASNYAESPGSFRAPIFYDSGNTGYYFDGTATSRWTTSNQDGFHSFNNYGLGVVGLYASTRFQCVFAMGDAYKGNADGTSLAGAYGLWWSYPSAGGPAATLSSHGLMCIVNGSNVAQLDASTRAVTDMRAPIFYDLGNTAYYVDPNGTSALNIATFGTSPAGGGGGGRIIPSTGSPYSLRQEFGSDNSGWRYGIAKNVSGTVTIMFYVQDNGDCVATGNVTAYSDVRLKANIETIPSALDKLEQIRGVTYTRTDMDDKERRYAGVIAQEIETVLPEAVGGDEDIKTVDYNATIGLLIQAVKELTDKVKALEAKE